MSGVKRILVATDLSTRADKALARAAQLATQAEAKLTVLHVLEYPSLEQRGRLADHLELEAKQMLQQKVATLALQAATPVTLRIAWGKPFVEIIRHAREEQADIVVVGAHGEHSWKDMFLGTTAEKVVRKGDRTVLTVKQAARGTYRRVLVPVDFSECSRSALRLALRLAPEADFHVLHAYETCFEGRLGTHGMLDEDIAQYGRQAADAARQDMAAFLESVDFGTRPVKRMVRHGRAPHVIHTLAERLQADLVAVGTTGRTRLPYILLGSVAEHVLREVKGDVLAVRSGPVPFELP